MSKYRADFLPAAGCGIRTHFALGRLLAAPGGLGGPSGINPTQFAPACLILKKSVLCRPNRVKIAKVCGTTKNAPFWGTRAICAIRRDTPCQLADTFPLDPSGQKLGIFAEILIFTWTTHLLKGCRGAQKGPCGVWPAQLGFLHCKAPFAYYTPLLHQIQLSLHRRALF